MGIGMPRRTAQKRRVYVNGTYCESLSVAAKEASLILGQSVDYWRIQRVANGKIKIDGIEITERKETERKEKDVDCQFKEHGKKPLLRYPLGEKPIDRGIRK